MLSKSIGTAELAELARRGSRHELSITVTTLARLAEIVVTSVNGHNGSLVAEIRVDNGSEGFPRIWIVVTGSVTLPCQRCLRPVEWAVNVNSRLTVLRDEAESAKLAEPFDSVVMGVDGFLLSTLIEDEVLAALPMAPVHVTAADCAKAGASNIDLESNAEPTYRPFANLAASVAAAGEGKKGSDRR